VDVDSLDSADEESRALQQPAQRAHDRREIEIARSDFVKHRREQEVVLPVHECDLDVRLTREDSLELARGGESAESAAEDDDAGRFLRGHGQPTTAMPTSS